MKMQLAIFAIFFMAHSAHTSSHVPALVWSNKPDNVQNHLQYSSQVSNINSNDLISNFVDRNIPVVAFVQNSISVEQFSANNAPFVASIFKNSQNEPVFYTNVNNVPNSLSTFSEDENKIGSKNVLINLNGQTIKENDETLRSYFEKYNNTGAVFLFTGKKNEFNSERSKRATDNEKEPIILGGKHTDGQYCFFLHFSTGNVTYQDDKKPIEDEFVNDKNLSIKPVCDTVSTTVEGKKQDQYFLKNFIISLKTKNGKDISIELNIKNALGNWYVESMNAIIDGKEYKAKNLLSTPGGFSRSCQKETFNLLREEKEKKNIYRARIVFNRFQLQPFSKSAIADLDKFSFTNASDCAVWFTLPLISGLIVVLLLLSILYSGVRALMSIMTPDRFENPKGKGLIITNFEE